MDAADVCLLVAEVGGGVVGYGRAGRLGRRPDAGGTLPEGWYLLGVAIVDAWRRRGIGRVLTERRLAWIAERTHEAWYFVNARNLPSIDLHRDFGFVEVSRRLDAAGVSFEGGEGILFRLDLSGYPGRTRSR